MATFTCAWIYVAVFLGCVCVCNSEAVVVQHNCNFEFGLCGWEYYSKADLREVGLVQPSDARAPRLGPLTDANPGNATGHYYYFYYPQFYEGTYIVGFPNYQYICSLSFAYAVDGATTFRLRRWNYDETDVNTVIPSVPLNVTGPWQKAYLNFTLPAVNTIYPLYFEQLVVDVGEAPSINEEIFLALDDINITFCLPCNFDRLNAEGSLILDVPSVIPVQISAVTNTTVVASSSICPSATFVYTIESVFPAQLAPIFSLDQYSGVLSVDARGPFLDANGTAGNITISTYVLGSNYTNLFPAFKVYRTATFYQDQVITVLNPPTIDVSIGVPFSFHINASSPLDYDMPLTYYLLSSQTAALSDYVTVEPIYGDVNGLINVQQLASVLSPSNTTPSLTFKIVNQYGAKLIWTVQLVFVPSPPFFTQHSYTFYVQPISGVSPLGTLSVVDPHQRQLQLPQLNFSNSSDSSLFQLACTGSFECTLLWKQGGSNLYKSNYTFAVLTYPVSSPSLIASASIFVGLYPINAYVPVITPKSANLTVLDNLPAGTILSRFSAQDNDTGSAGNVTFVLGNGNIGGFFTISSSGELGVASTPLYPTAYSLIVLAVDGGTPSRVGRAYINVTVIAANPVDCSDANYYSPPVIISPTSFTWDTVAGTNVTLSCSVAPNTLPAVLTTWVVIPLPPSNHPHYQISGSSILLLGVTNNDTGVYQCTVTNQCGSSYTGFVLTVLDVPNPPSQVHINGTVNPNNVTINWVYVGFDNMYTSTAVDHFVIELKISGQTDFRAVAKLPWDATSFTLTGLTPFTTYYVRVVAVNAAGSTPSLYILNIVTLTSAPQLKYLVATVLANQSLLISWQLDFDGGQPVTSINMTVQALDSSPTPARASGRPGSMTYSVGGNATSITTTSFPQGWVYLISATVQNKVGTSTSETKVFVGSSYTTVCSYEMLSCHWLMLDGRKVAAGTGGSLQPLVDADGNINGHYWSLQTDTPLSNWEVLSYPSAEWLCGFSFDYFLQGNSSLTLKSLSGEDLWSGTSAALTVGTDWNHATLLDQWIVPSISREKLRFVFNSHDNQSTVALDNIALTFCAPCSIEQLQRSISTISTNTTIYLRVESNVSLQTSVSHECSAAVLGYSIAGVDPVCVKSSFNIPDQSYGIVHVGGISPLLASSGTHGALQVAVSIVGSGFDGNPITQNAKIGFILEELTGQCANVSHCDFSVDSCQWEFGPNITTAQDTSSPLATMHYLQGYATRMNQIILSTVINDDYCEITFNYMITRSEMAIRVQGLGTIWIASAPNTTQAWAFQSVPIDLTSVGIWRGRTLSFEVYGSSVVPMSSSYGVANVTLLPCVDCQARECHCLSCMPGSYFSIKQDKCIACPAGYYCLEALDLPQPCPEGTYNPVTMLASASGCQICPNGYYSFLGQSACKPCPSGFSCSDPAKPLPVAMSGAAVIAISVIIVVAILIAVALSLYCCYCIRKSRVDRMKERAKYLNSRWNTQVTEQSVVSTPDMEGQKRRTLDPMATQEGVIVYSNVLYEGDDASMSSVPAAVLHSTPALPQKDDKRKMEEEEEAEETDLIQFSEMREWGKKQH